MGTERNDSREVGPLRPCLPAAFSAWVASPSERGANPASTSARRISTGPLRISSRRRPISTTVFIPRRSASSSVSHLGAAQTLMSAGRRYSGLSSSRAATMLSIGDAMGVNSAKARSRRGVKDHLVARRRTESHSSAVLMSRTPSALDVNVSYGT